ncbi:MAG: hypothetical protein NXI31_14380 [bacterium]|nr:hypothetical protein [bacterium]
MTRSAKLPFLAGLGCCLGWLAPASPGQSPNQFLTDLTDKRNPTLPYRSLFQVEAGMIGTTAASEDPAVGLEDGFSWDGHVYYRDEDFGERKGTLVGYAGRDGIYAGLFDGQLIGDQTITRLEFKARPWQFYRDGSYNGDTFSPNGLYEGSDYEGYLGFGREAAPGLFIEIGTYYRDHSFSTSPLTAGAFQIPEDFAAYGARVYLEQNTTQLDRRRGTPRDGGVVTIVAEQEWNDSSGSFGAPGFTTTLPDQIWRVRGNAEVYLPASDNTFWEVFLRGQWADRKDRVQNFEAQRPLGHQWAEGFLRLRIHFGDSWTLTPFVHGQWSRIVGAGGGSSTQEVFFGGGVESYLHFNESISLHGWYSFLDNESRPSIKINEDVHGEHMFYLGVVMRFGGARR